MVRERHIRLPFSSNADIFVVMQGQHEEMETAVFYHLGINDLNHIYLKAVFLKIQNIKHARQEYLPGLNDRY